MIASGHSAVGFMIGYSIVKTSPDPILGMGLGFVSGIVTHYLCDLIPHGHFGKNLRLNFSKTNLYIFADLIISFSILFIFSYLLFDKSWSLLIITTTMVASQLPDLFDAWVHFLHKDFNKLLNWEYKFHQHVHWHGTGMKTILISWRDFWQFLILLIALVLPVIY